MVKTMWEREQADWWLRDLTTVPNADRLQHERALHGYWQKAAYETGEFTGTMLLANPSADAPEVRIPLPVCGRYGVSIGMPENYSDRLLIKLERDRCYDKLRHGGVVAGPSLQECWWKDAELVEGDVLVVKQDGCMNRRCGIAYVRLSLAPPATAPEVPLVAVMDGSPCNNGPLPLDEMVGEELQFADAQVSDIHHGTDICGFANYNTKTPTHRYPSEKIAEEEFISADYYPWIPQQILKFEKAGRCTLEESIEAAHGTGRKFYAYYRMGITQLYAPMRMFGSPLYDEHPEWRCMDWDGTPVSRLSFAFPAVRQHVLEHFRETIEKGADGVCLVFARGWPLILFEEPVAVEYEKRTGKSMRDAGPDDPELLRVRTDCITGFMREILETITEAADGRDVGIAAIPLALPEINRHYAMDCSAWAKEGLVQMLCPYPYGYTATAEAVKVPEWVEVVKGTGTRLCPILNRMTYEPAGIVEDLPMFLDRAEQWLREGADGFAVWDLDSAVASPVYRRLAYHVASGEGRRRLHEMLDSPWPIRYALKSLDGIRVDRYHPGWCV